MCFYNGQYLWNTFMKQGSTPKRQTSYMHVSTELSAGVCLLFLPALSFLMLGTVPTLYSLSFTSNVSYAISPLPINAKLDACCQRSLTLMECMVIICNQDNALRSLHCSLERKKEKKKKGKERKRERKSMLHAHLCHQQSVQK